jgi:pyruvate kinase
MELPHHKTKLVCTIGPASESQGVMEQMIQAGMGVARLNFSHGAFSGHEAIIRKLRAAERATGHRITIMADLPGPKMRIGKLRQEPIFLREGGAFVFRGADEIGDETGASTTFPLLARTVKPGDALFLNDGVIRLDVERIQGNDVHCRVLTGGELRSRKGLNLPGIDLGISAFTEHDAACLKFSLENGVDAISQSFVERAEDIQAVRAAAASLGFNPFIIAKIERSRALHVIEEIIDAADGIMIARGDLGVELPIEQLPVMQKRLIRLANMRAKPVITATQMLESMISNRRPTRAEATDVANAILDGTDCVMLSGESAIGSYPVDAVATLARIASATEPYRLSINPRELFGGIELKDKVPAARLTDLAIDSVLQYSSRIVVVVATQSGQAARSIARIRPLAWIVAVSSLEETCRQLAFSYGVHGIHEPEAIGDWSTYSQDWLEAQHLEADILVIAQERVHKDSGPHYTMEIVDLKELRGQANKQIREAQLQQTGGTIRATNL